MNDRSAQYAPWAIVGVAILATWEAWRWLWMRLSPSPEEGLSLALVAVFLVWAGRQQPQGQDTPRLERDASVGLVVYAAAVMLMPSIVQAAVAVVLVAYAAHVAAFGLRPRAAVLPLVALALPVVPSLQFVLGHPLRVVSASAATVLLQTQGLRVSRQGTFLVWQDRMVQFDAPCSGVNMLWAGLVLTLAASTLLRLSLLRSALALFAAVVVIWIANVLRAVSLFHAETTFAGLTPSWWHDGVGLLTFAGAAGVSLMCVRAMARWEAPRWAR
jgi:exosortase